MKGTAVILPQGSTLIQQSPYQKVFWDRTGIYFKLGKSMNIFKEMLTMGMPERWILSVAITDASYKSNVAKIEPKNTTETTYLKKGYKSLFERGLIARVKRSHYIINPSLVIPPQAYLLDILVEWNRVCVPSARIEYSTNEELRSHDVDLDDLFVQIQQEDVSKLSDDTILRFVELGKQMCWIDSTHQTLPACPNQVRASLVIAEGLKRNLI